MKDIDIPLLFSCAEALKINKENFEKGKITAAQRKHIDNTFLTIAALALVQQALIKLGDK